MKTCLSLLNRFRFSQNAEIEIQPITDSGECTSVARRIQIGIGTRPTSKERNLPKVDVEGSIPFARSKILRILPFVKNLP